MCAEILAIAIPKFRQPLARLSFSVLGRLVLCDRPEVWPALCDRARRLFRCVTLAQVDKKVMTAVLLRIAHTDSDFLRRMVYEDCFDAVNPLPPSNQLALVVAIIAEEGAGSDLVEAMFRYEKTPNRVKSRILKARGI